MFSPSDDVEFSARVRHEHNLRGFEWIDFVKDRKNGLNYKDFIWADYPSDEKIIKAGIRGLFIGNFLLKEREVSFPVLFECVFILKFIIFLIC